jgi:hypothetical protein
MASSARSAGSERNPMVLRQGTDPDYIRRRLARVRPDILAAWKRGEFRSARAAAIAAGVAKPRTPLKALRAAWKRANSEEQAAFLAENRLTRAE